MKKPKKKIVRILLLVIFFGAALSFVPKSPYQIRTITDPVLLSVGIIIPPGVNFSRPQPGPAPRNYANLSRDNLKQSGIQWLREALNDRNESQVRELIDQLPPLEVRRFRQSDREMDNQLRFVLEVLPREREEERRRDEEDRMQQDKYYPEGMRVELRRSGRTKLITSLINRSDKELVTAVHPRFLVPIYGNIGFVAWRPGDSRPVVFSPSLFVADLAGGAAYRYRPGEGVAIECDLSPLFDRPGLYRIQGGVAYRGEASNVVEIDVGHVEAAYSRLRTMLFFTADPGYRSAYIELVARLSKWIHP